MIAIGVGLIVGLAYVGRSGGPGQEDGPKVPIAAVDGIPVTLQAVEDQFQLATRNATNAGQILTPSMTAQAYGDIVTRQVNEAILTKLARDNKVEVTDDDLIRSAQTEIEGEIARIRMQLSMEGKLKPTATDAEFEAELKKLTGKDSSQLRAEAIDRFRKALDDPKQREQEVGMRIGQILQEAYVSRTRISDEDLKKGYDTWVTKRIFFSPFERPDEDLAAKAERVLAEIKGGLSFEAAMERYSDDKAPQGKKKSDPTIDLNRAIIAYDDTYAPLVEMKPGDVSPVVASMRGVEIFKLIKIEPKIPDDFDKRKEDYRKTRAREVGSKRLQQDMKRIRETGVKWESPGFKAMHDWYWATVDPAVVGDKRKRREAMRKAYDDAKAAAEAADVAGPRAAVLAQFGAFDELWRASSKEQQAELEKPRMEVLSAILEIAETGDLRLELGKLQMKHKRLEEAAGNFLSAAEQNFDFEDTGITRSEEIASLRTQLEQNGLKDENALKRLDEELKRYRQDVFENLRAQAETNQDFSESGQRLYNTINSRVAKLQAKGWLSSEQAAEVAKFQKAWRDGKAKQEKEDAEERRRAEEEAKRAAEKEKADAKAKAGGAPAPTGSTSGTAGGADKGP